MSLHMSRYRQDIYIVCVTVVNWPPHSLLSSMCWTSPEVRSAKEEVTPLKRGYSSAEAANPGNHMAAVCNLRVNWKCLLCFLAQEAVLLGEE